MRKVFFANARVGSPLGAGGARGPHNPKKHPHSSPDEAPKGAQAVPRPAEAYGVCGASNDEAANIDQRSFEKA
jgi:hypothetical protein